MDYKVMDYSELHMDNIAMTREEWRRAYSASMGMATKAEKNACVMQIYWESVVWTDGFPECLKGLPLEEQLDRYAVREDSEHSRSSYGEEDKSRAVSGTCIPLKEYERFKGVIVKDGMIVGAVISNYYGNSCIVHPGRPQCIYWSVDSDGTGSSSSDTYVYMCCVPSEK